MTTSNDGLLVIERIVLESLAKKSKNLEELSLDTNLDSSLLLNILPLLSMKNIVSYNKGHYFLNADIFKGQLRLINSASAIKEEVKELFVSLVNNYFSKQKENDAFLKVKKIFLTNDEEKIFQAHLKNLESFIKNIEDQRHKRPVYSKLAEHKVIIWGHSKYSELVNSIVNAV